jgi:N-acetylmuramoyl-L-alanine amidase
MRTAVYSYGRNSNKTRVNRLAATLLAALFVLPHVCLLQAAEQLTRIQFWSMGTSTRIAVEFSSEFKFKSAKIENPDRIFFDIPNTTFSLDGKTRGLYTLPVGDKLVKQIRVANQTVSSTRLVVDLEADALYTVAELKSPNRLIIEVYPAGAPPAPTEAPSVTASVSVAKPEIRKFEPPAEAPRQPRKYSDPLKAVDPPPTVASRVDPQPRQLNTLSRTATPPPAPQSPSSLQPVPSTLVAAKTTSSTPPALTAPSLEAPAVSKPARVATMANANSTGDRSLTRALGLKLNRVVIDAGHGGHDDGTTGFNGLKEKDLVLDLAMRVGKLVQERLGSEVIYTRDTDEFITLERRPEIANERHADLFLSIHANFSSIRSVSGVETYYLSVASTKAALEVAARENAASQMSIADLEQLVQRITLNDKLKESMEFAGRMQLAISSGTGTGGVRARNRGVRKAPFIVLIGAKMPAILAEVGFVSNAQDEAAMMTSEYRDRMADAICKGIESYSQTLSRFHLAGAPPANSKPTAVISESTTTTTPHTNTPTHAPRRTSASARVRRSGAAN